MRPYWIFGAWTTGTYRVDATIPLNWQKRYLVTACLTLTDGDDYAHVYVSKICNYYGGDVVKCGIRDIPDDFKVWAVEIIDHASSVTLTLKTKGGRHMAEGMVYEL